MSMQTGHGPRLELRQSQGLVMTQSLQQSIKLLQMNSQELQAYINTQLEENPFLSADEEQAEQEPARERGDEGAGDGEFGEEFMPEQWREEGDSGVSQDGSELRLQVVARDTNGDALDFGDTKEREVSLRDHLLEQLYIEVNDPALRAIGTYLIDLTDDAGYIKEPIDSLAEQLGTDASHIYHTLAILQKCDPSGVCARDLAECLAIQLRDKNRYDPAMQALLANLPLLAQGNLTQLERICGVDVEDLREMVAEIRALNPKPGLAFAREIVQNVEPDVTVRREQKAQGKSGWHVELNTSALPRVLVNRRYFAKVSVKAGGADKKYITEQMTHANWLVRALDQRANTILKVASEIVAQQEGFFRMGIHHLKPLTLKDVARETGFHESTVSRVTSGKYMITPRGTFELKYFFTSGLSHGAGGEDVSSQTVKHLIRELIDQEAPKQVLSDDDIADRLKARNINVARRTVAKYREALGLPSSTERRRRYAIKQ